jgi:prepilin-type N-terminal cleavage/methylation domain-containing protein
MKSLFPSKGFTLIETIVTVAITAAISLALGAMIVFFYKTNAYTLEQSTAVEEARRSLNAAMTPLRSASYASDGSYPIAVAASTTLTFYANNDVDATLEQVTYTLIGSTFYKVVVNPGGSPLTYVGQPPATSTISIYVQNATTTPVFTYYDSTGTALTYPINISKISSINTTVRIDVNQNRAPVTFTLSASATLRNLEKEQ